MKSKTSFINKTILEKNIKLYWPIWVLYLVVILLQGPFTMWRRYRSAEYYYGDNWKNYELDIMSSTLSIRVTIVFIFIMAILTGMALFSYLYNSRACNMIHAMPVTRKQLYLTNIVTGLLFMWIPMLIRYALSLIICIAYGSTQVAYIGIWLLASMGISFFVYSLVCLSAMFTGQLISMPVIYVVINAIYGAIVVVMASVVSYVSYGISYSKLIYKAGYKWLSPFIELMDKVGFDATMKDTKEMYFCENYNFRGTTTIILYVCGALAVYLVAYLLYKRRNLENAGNLIAVPVIKPVFKWGIGCLIGLGGSVMVAGLITEMRISVGVFKTALLTVLLGAIAFCLLDMLINKNFKIISRRFFKELAVYTVFVVVIFGGIAVYGHSQENYIPEASDVDYAYINMDYQIILDGSDVSKVIEAQKAIMAQKKYYFDYRYEDSNYTGIEYVLKDGSKIYREYQTPDKYVDLHKVCSMIVEEEKKPKNVIKNIMQCSNPDNVELVDGSFTQYDSNYNVVAAKKLDSNAACDIYDAVIQDLEEGSLQQYVVSQLSDRNGDQGYVCDLYLTYNIPKGNGLLGSVDSQEEPFGSYLFKRLLGLMDYGIIYEMEASNSKTPYTAYIEFGPDCTNLINVLEKYQIIDSKASLLTYEQLND